jgi:hypothetical protein
MSKLMTRNLMVGLGAVLILVAVFADSLGLGREPRFGWKQGILLVVGLALVVGGVLWRRVSR